MVLLIEKYKEKTIEMYNSGKSIRTIAKSLGCSITPIKTILRENQIDTTRDRWFYFQKKFKMSKEWLYQKYVVEKLTSYQISKLGGIAQSSLHRWIKIYGLKRNRFVPKEMRKRISKTLKSKFLSGKLTPPGMTKKCIDAARISNTGRKQSKKTIEKRVSQFRGENHWQWKGGQGSISRQLRASWQWKEWRRKIFKRDSYTCQDCEKRGVFLNAHHIIPVKKCVKLNWIEKVFDVDNGLTLCKPCHQNLHWGGTRS